MKDKCKSTIKNLDPVTRVEIWNVIARAIDEARDIDETSCGLEYIYAPNEIIAEAILLIEKILTGEIHINRR
jgi:hypothetical protein